MANLLATDSRGAGQRDFGVEPSTRCRNLSGECEREPPLGRLGGAGAWNSDADGGQGAAWSVGEGSWAVGSVLA
jgi:hypothetical protein